MNETLTPFDTAVEQPPAQTVAWLVLVIACLAQFMVVLDATVVNIALPSVQRGLHFSAANLPWVVNGYTLDVRRLPAAGRACGGPDRAQAAVHSRRDPVLRGVPDQRRGPVLRDADRRPGLQGLGGALVSPAALAIITTTFTDSGERTKALGVWSAIAASGAAVGLLMGGILTDIASWRWVFFVNVPVGVITIAMAAALGRGVTDRGRASVL